MNPRAILPGGIFLLAAALACTLGSAAPTETPDLVATITAQAQALEARTPAAPREGELGTTTADAVGTPTTSAANSTPQQPPAPKATKTPKPTKTAAPTSTVANTVVPTLSVPQAPGDLAGSTNCPQSPKSVDGDLIWQAVVTLTWQDSDTETAYRLYRNGTPYTTVILQDATSWPIYVEYPYTASNSSEYDYFELEAYNSAGVSPKAPAYVFRCHYQ